jgi:hypothetical protein
LYIDITVAIEISQLSVCDGEAANGRKFGLSAAAAFGVPVWLESGKFPVATAVAVNLKQNLGAFHYHFGYDNFSL